jgi:hypothetical protein
MLSQATSCGEHFRGTRSSRITAPAIPQDAERRTVLPMHYKGLAPSVLFYLYVAFEEASLLPLVRRSDACMSIRIYI